MFRLDLTLNFLRQILREWAVQKLFPFRYRCHSKLYGSSSLYFVGFAKYLCSVAMLFWALQKSMKSIIEGNSTGIDQ